MAGRTFEAKVTAGFLSIPFIIYIQIYFNTPCAHYMVLHCNNLNILLVQYRPYIKVEWNRVHDCIEGVNTANKNAGICLVKKGSKKWDAKLNRKTLRNSSILETELHFIRVPVATRICTVVGKLCIKFPSSKHIYIYIYLDEYL